MLGAIIPARGGSRGIPGKNLRVVGGKTLLARAIETCRAAHLPVVVSTDCDHIAAEAALNGAEVHVRPRVLAADDVPSWAVLREVARIWNGWNTLAWVQCTAPLLTPMDIRNCLQSLSFGDMAVCVHECHSLEFDGDGKPLFEIPAKCRQAMQPRAAVSGSCWTFKRKYLLERECYEGVVKPVLSENPMRLDIDTPEDLKIAEVLLSTEAEHAVG